MSPGGADVILPTQSPKKTGSRAGVVRQNMTTQPDRASAAQIRFMKRLGITAPIGVTKAAASDLIGSKLSPEAEAIETLKFFQVDVNGMTQTDARRALEGLLKNPENKKKWVARPATGAQKAQLKFFGQPIPRGLDHATAEKLIADILADDAKADAWAAEEDRLDQVKDLRDTCNDFASDNGCKKLSVALFRQAFEALQAAGISTEKMQDNDCARLLARAATIDPSIIKDRGRFEFFIAPFSDPHLAELPTAAPRTVSPMAARSAAGSAVRGWLWIALIAVGVVWWYFQAR